MYQKFSSLSNRLLDLKTLFQTRQDDWVSERRRSNTHEIEARDALIKEIGVLKGMMQPVEMANVEIQTIEADKGTVERKGENGKKSMEYSKPTDPLNHSALDTLFIGRHKRATSSSQEGTSAESVQQEAEQDSYTRSSTHVLTPPQSSQLPPTTWEKVSIPGISSEVDRTMMKGEEWNKKRASSSQADDGYYKKKRKEDVIIIATPPSCAATPSLVRTRSPPHETQSHSSKSFITPQSHRRNKRILIEKDDSDTEHESLEAEGIDRGIGVGVNIVIHTQETGENGGTFDRNDDEDGDQLTPRHMPNQQAL